MAERPANSAGTLLASAEDVALPQQTDTRIRVMLPLPLPQLLDYLAPRGALPPPGSFVRVGLGSRQLVGVVWDGKDAAEVPAERLKPVGEVLPAPPLRPELRRFVDPVAAYTLAPAGPGLPMTACIH